MVHNVTSVGATSAQVPHLNPANEGAVPNNLPDAFSNIELLDYVKRRLKNRWSAEQISGRIWQDHPKRWMDYAVDNSGYCRLDQDREPSRWHNRLPSPPSQAYWF